MFPFLKILLAIFIASWRDPIDLWLWSPCTGKSKLFNTYIFHKNMVHLYNTHDTHIQGPTSHWICRNLHGGCSPLLLEIWRLPPWILSSLTLSTMPQVSNPAPKSSCLPHSFSYTSSPTQFKHKHKQNPGDIVFANLPTGAKNKWEKKKTQPQFGSVQ